MDEIVSLLKVRGQRTDSEIAEALNLPPAKVRKRLEQLISDGEVISCKVTRFVDGQAIEAILCRAAAFSPPPRPGRKPAAKPKP